MADKDIETKIVQHDEQIKTLFNNYNRLEKVVDKIDNLTVSIEKMTIVQQEMLKEQKKVRDDVDKIKEQPVKDAHEIKMKIISCIATGVVGAVLGALLALIIKG